MEFLISNGKLNIQFEGGLKNLKYLENILGYRIIPEFIFESKNLETLTISIDKLKFKDIYSLPTSLKFVGLYINKTMEGNIIPADLFTLPNLVQLDLGFNKKFKGKLLLIGQSGMQPSKSNQIHSNLEVLRIPIDLSLEVNINYLKQLKKLSTLYVEKMSGDNLELLKELAFIKKIHVNKIASDIDIKSLPSNISWNFIDKSNHP